MNVRLLRDTLAAVTACLLLAPGAAAENRALIIGIGDYQMDGADLPGIDKDVQMMAEIAGLLGFRPPQIRVLADRDATQANVERALTTWLVNGVGPGDRVLIGYSGHGAYTRDRNGDESDRRDELLVLHDARRAGGRLRGVLVDDRFHAMLARIPARSVFVLIDSCHSGSATRVAPADGLVVKSLDLEEPSRDFVTPVNGFTKATRGGVIAIAAARDDQQSLAGPNGSVFTVAAHEVIVAAARSRRSLTPRELTRQVDSLIGRRVASERRHNPVLTASAAAAGQALPLAGAPATSAPGGAPPGGSSADGAAWARLTELAESMPARLQLAANSASFSLGQRLEIRVTIPVRGYLNVVSVDSSDQVTVLFPNGHHPQNLVSPGALVMPAAEMGFDWVATEPVGRALVVAFLTTKPVNLHESGRGAGPYRAPTADALRGFQVVERPGGAGGGAGAGGGDVSASGRVTLTIRR